MKLSGFKLLAIAAGAALLLSGCSSSASSKPTEGDASSGAPVGNEVTTEANPELHELLPEDIISRGSINVAMGLPSPPSSMYDDNQRPVGFDPELARLLGQKLDIDIKIEKQAFDSVIPSLQAGKHDIVMTGMTDTPERQKTLTFIDYTYAGFAIVVKKGNPDGIETQDDLCGRTVAIQKATVQADILRALDCGGDDVKLLELPSDLDGQTALRAGKADAFSTDALPAEYMVANTGNGKSFEIVRDPDNPKGFSPVYNGIGVLKDKTELIDALQAAFQELIDEGTYKEVADRNNYTPYMVESAETNQGVAQ